MGLGEIGSVLGLDKNFGYFLLPAWDASCMGPFDYAQGDKARATSNVNTKSNCDGQKCPSHTFTFLPAPSCAQGSEGRRRRSLLKSESGRDFAHLVMLARLQFVRDDGGDA